MSCVYCGANAHNSNQCPRLDATSAEATGEIAGQPSSLALDRGWGPVSSAQILSASCTLEILAELEGEHIAKRFKETAYILRLRADAARASERQPRPNVEMSHEPERK